MRSTSTPKWSETIGLFFPLKILHSYLADSKNKIHKMHIFENSTNIHFIDTYLPKLGWDKPL